jgi:TolA-binding protein
MYKLLDWFPNGSLADHSLLLVGENLNRAGKESEARELYLDFLKRFPDSTRVAKIKLSVAQTFVHEKKWTNAIMAFNAWVTNFPDHPMLPEGEFSRALAHDKAGMQTNAFILFTNFVARFPSNHLASLAQNWVADFYWNHEDYRNAEKSYQELYQKFNPTAELGYQARLMAGRAAYDRSDYTEAAKYFGALISLLEADTNSSATLRAEVYFALGDTYFQDFLSNTNSDVKQAIAALTRITKEFSTNSLMPLAWGRMGDCYFQWAALDSAEAGTRYQRAMECYGMVVESKIASVAARSQAEVAIGTICEKEAAREYKEKWLDAALKHYMNVVTESNLRDGESFDAKWMYEAGVAAAKLCESSEQWEQAVEIYGRLAKLLPPLRPAVEKKIVAARTHLETVKN